MSATFILDGSNLAWLGPGDGPAIAPVDAIADALRAEWPGCKVITLCDASLRHRLSPADKAEHQRRTAAGELVEAPADEDADAYILESARRLGGCVVTRDLYRDRREARAGVPMLRPALIGGAVILGDPKVFATADSDRGEPMPEDALGPRVPPAPLPGGTPVDAVEAEEPTDAATPAEPPPEPAPEVGPASAQAGADEPDDEPDEPAKPRAPRKKSTNTRNTGAGAGAKKKSTTRRSAPKTAHRSTSKRSPAQAEPPTRQTAIGALILLTLLGGIGGLTWWLTAEEPAPAPVTEPGVLFARNCKGWALAGGRERIVFHAQPDQCTVSIAAAGPERFLATVAEGPAPSTTGRVWLVTADNTAEQAAVELTRGRPGAGEVPAEHATARIVGVDPQAGLVALRVAPSAERPPIWLVRQIDGDVRGHSEAVVGLALAPGHAAALDHHCAAGCGSVHIADDVTAALGAAEAASPPEGPAYRWAGPAAFSPDGSQLAVAEAFAGHRGGVVIVDVASGKRRRLAFTARERGEVTGIAWTSEGLFLGAAGALYRADPQVGDWQAVSRRPESLAPAAR